MCWAAKWYGEEDVYFNSIHQSSPRAMLKQIHRMLNEADAVIHFNGTKFDIPTLNKEFLLYGMSPPAPYKQIDLLRTARSQFRFPSNKLDYIAQALGVGEKVPNRGHQLWIDCMAKDPAAWEEMAEYNINDVIILEKVYDKLLPWVRNHPNQNLYTNGEHVCPKCGGTHLHKRGFSHTISGIYQRYQCNSCKGWSRNVKKVKESLAITGAA
jgi:uncharacterized protein YprB with RNaseH-like and TPR domain/predicted RNA-binding Zn-ribbon protein involved in translation (DUF1610 family)